MNILKKDNLAFTLMISAFCVYAAAFIFKTSFVIDGERYFSLFDDMMICMKYAENLANGQSTEIDLEHRGPIDKSVSGPDDLAIDGELEWSHVLAQVGTESVRAYLADQDPVVIRVAYEALFAAHVKPISLFVVVVLHEKGVLTAESVGAPL